MTTNNNAIPGSDREDTNLAITIAATILGAAAGSRLADDLVGGSGLPSALAQLGGAILGGIGGKALSDALQDETKALK
jgi:outer membrane lipoprotein SlyB